MTDKENKDSIFNQDLSYLDEIKKMKDNGASNTQIRAALEERGWKDIKFHDDDVGKNAGTPPTEPSLYDSRPVNQLGPRGEASSMDKPFSAAIKGFAPAFDAAVARRHLYKDLLIRMNEEINKGPLKGIVFFTGVINSRIAPVSLQFTFSVTWSHKSRNRMKAYNNYFNGLKTKYLLEIAEAEAKVMERE